MATQDVTRSICHHGFRVHTLLTVFVLLLPQFEAASQLGQKIPRSRVERDTYYRQAKELGYRARSAFKLLQLDREFSLLQNVSTAIDLCSAPGSWTQVLTNSLAKQGCSDAAIVSVDIQPMRAVPGAIHIRGDITAPETEREIWSALGERKADIVVCDGAPDVTGLHELDRHVPKPHCPHFPSLSFSSLVSCKADCDVTPAGRP
eukprot:2396405-Rhodomonas_salina.2